MRRRLAAPFVTILFCLLAAIWLIPVLFSLTISMKGKTEFLAGNLLDLPRSLLDFLPNLVSAWQLSELGMTFLNSIFYASLGTVIAVIFSSLAAYSLAHLKIRLRNLFFFLIFAGTIFPVQIYLVPLYVMYAKLGLYDTKVGLLLFYAAISIPFCLLVLRSYFTTIPDSMMEAAVLDGASSFVRYVRLVLPMSVAPIISLILLQYTWIWNDLIFGIILTKSNNTRPIMVSIMMLSGEVYMIGTVPQRVAAALIASAPPLVLFLALRSYFMRGFRMLTIGS